MPNAFAPIALILWIPLTFALFAWLRPAVAGTVSIVGAGILLPVGFSFDVKGFPALGRNEMASLSVLSAVLLFHRRLSARRPPLRGVEWLVGIMVLGGFATALSNDAPRDAGVFLQPGLTLWDGVGAAGQSLLLFGLPFYLGRILYRTPRDLYSLLLVLVAASLAYSALILWETRMSPHLHYWVYGYQPAAFRMAQREWLFGWRPMVFVGHGISLGLFVATCTLAAIGLWRAGASYLGSLGRLVPAYLFAVVIACNSFAAMIYAAVATPLAAFARPRVQVLALLVLAAIPLSYPALRTTGLVPTRNLVDAAAVFSETRAASLEFRFENEEKLLGHFRKRPLLGWGGYGRDRLYHPETGSEIVTIDGYWLLALGQWGIVGFLCAFGLLLVPVIGSARQVRRRPRSREAALVLAVAWIVVIHAIDLLPNGFLESRPVFFAGALTGALQGWARLKPARRGSRPPGRPSEQEEPEGEPPPIRVGAAMLGRWPRGPGRVRRDPR